MGEGGGRVVDVTEDTTITTFRGGVAHAHTVCLCSLRSADQEGRVDVSKQTFRLGQSFSEANLNVRDSL